MKKITAVILSLLFVMGLCACGSEPVDQVTVQSLLDEGYVRGSIIYDAEKFRGEYHKEDNSSYYRISAKTQDVDTKSLEELDISDDNYDAKYNKIIANTKNMKVECIDSEIPKQADMDKYIGKTIKEIEESGLSEYGYLETDEKIVYSYSDEKAIMDMEIDMSQIKADDKAAYIVKSVTFIGFADEFLFQ